MDGTLLRAFIETAEAGSVSRAARRLELSQPSLSSQIQRLEHQLGVSLFNRHGRGVALTDAGKALLPRARRIVDEMIATEDAVRREGSEAAETLFVGVIPTIAPYVLPDALRRMRVQMPNLRFEFREDYSANLARMLHDRALDVVIAARPFPFEPLDVEVLGTDSLLVAVPATHTAARAGRITLAQMKESPAVMLDPAHCLGEQVSGFCNSNEVRPSVVCRSAQLATVLELVGAGAGVSIVPALAAVRYNTPQCAYLTLEGHDLTRDIVAVWPRSGVRDGAARAFVQSVRDVLHRGNG